MEAAALVGFDQLEPVRVLLAEGERVAVHVVEHTELHVASLSVGAGARIFSSCRPVMPGVWCRVAAERPQAVPAATRGSSRCGYVRACRACREIFRARAAPAPRARALAPARPARRAAPAWPFPRASAPAGAGGGRRGPCRGQSGRPAPAV